MIIRLLDILLKVACLGFAVWFAWCFFKISSISLFYPFPLEWMEGHTIDIMQRIVDGKPFYTEPTLEYVPYIYTPYYFYVSAFVSLFTGVDFLAARLVSVLCTLGTGGLLYVWIRKEGGSWLMGLVAAGLFLATYKISGRWFDVSRVDTMYLLFMAGGLYVFQYSKNRMDSVLAGALFAFAFFTKQSAPLALFPAFIAALLIDRRHAIRTAAVTGLLILVGSAWFEYISGGWYSFYIYDVPTGHKNDMRQVSLFWKRDLIPICAAMMILSTATLLLLARTNWRTGLWYTGILLGFVGSAYLSRIHSYGHVNVLIPAHFAFVLLAMVGAVRMHAIYPKVNVILMAGLVAQFYVLLYDPAKLIPTPSAEEKGWKFVDQIKKIDGKVLFSELQFIQTRAGKQSYSIGMAGFDIMRAELGEKNSIRTAYVEHIKNRLAVKEFGAVILGHFLTVPELSQYYRPQFEIPQPQEFVTGAVYVDKARVFFPR
ncbi:MAG: ArnT family glycosyltransferase [Alphaproteobacteria bacterium]